MARSGRPAGGLALAVLGAITVVLLQYMGAVFWLEGRNERDLASHGIVMGGEALNRAVVPAMWLTLALVVVEVAIGVVLARRRRRSRRLSTT